jgi:endonuclease/exonuclease/phosphatase family metal-dependent hydrolase
LSQNQNGVVVGDFNGDGRTDFLSANGNFDAWLATATGTFTPILAAPAPSWCTPASRCLSQNQNGVVVGDFNGDGRTDFLSANGNFDIWLAK